MADAALGLSRAELLWILADTTDQEAIRLAGRAGYVHRKQDLPPREPGPNEPSDDSPTGPDLADLPEPPSEARGKPPPAGSDMATTYWQVVGRFDQPQAPVDVPDWWPDEDDEPLPAQPHRHVQAPSVLSWPRMLGFLRQQMMQPVTSANLDVGAAVRMVAGGRYVKRLPRLSRPRWPAVVLLVDESPEMRPLRADYRRLASRLCAMLGPRLHRTTVRRHSPSAFEDVLHTARTVPANARWIILSDFGWLADAPQRSAQWFSWLDALRGYLPPGSRPLGLTPAPASAWSPELSNRIHLCLWDDGAPLRLASALPSAPTPQGDALELLLMGLALAGEAMPNAVRLLRRALPSTAQHVGNELQLWHHPDTRRLDPVCFLPPDKRAKWLGEANRRLALETPDPLVAQMAEAAKQATASYEAAVRDEALEVIEAVLRRERPGAGARDEHPVRKGAVAWLLRRWRSLPDGDEKLTLEGYIKRLSASLAADVQRNSLVLGATVRVADQIAAREGRTVASGDRRFDFIFQGVAVQQVELRQMGTSFALADDSTTLSAGSPVAQLRTRDRDVRVVLGKWAPVDRSFWEGGAAPEWAHGWGWDEYGAWAEFAVPNTDETEPAYQRIHRLRWLPPGRFLMGSPENEAERLDSEVQHEVALTEGLWLAETACTQWLWEAITGSNPSHFSGEPDLPVEQVSWEDVQQFLRRLNGLVHGLEARLPTEAEWEYGCRAGTSTPFSFGENVSPDEVNYDGHHPYAGAPKGKRRGRTVPVKHLSANAWGLHQMHGNVWEWCSDWFAAYPQGGAVDPTGPVDRPSGDASRVLRGGSWIYNAWRARSAYRFFGHPGYRGLSVGFRLALGQGRGAPRQQGPEGPSRARGRARDAGHARPAGSGVAEVSRLQPVVPSWGHAREISVVGDTEGLHLTRFAKPAWASAVGRDEFGLYAEFALGAATQRFRWLSPGRFLMGSPEDEAERADDETQHEVELTRGVWVADTACTQQLWEAVIGEPPPAGFLQRMAQRVGLRERSSELSPRPSHFVGADLPVETVSWEDVQEFLARLNGLLGGLDARLPTEAEWEYGCRAGTATPFSLGAGITPDEVNYDGEFPYAGGAKGDDRGRTVAVKSLPPNPWGLYEMHGNVWEWCADWYRPYAQGNASDPTGLPDQPSDDAGRVLRGGSWFSNAGYARSASRYHRPPGYRGYYVGFRLALGQ